MPPIRTYDHSIPLIPGAVPVNSRPYRYSRLHKDEIERQVKELLEAGLITSSNSPFASPVLLVQKKDGSWRFGVDYRKLNSLAIKNRFPMPIIEEILDELFGTKFFTKLDMRAGYHQFTMRVVDEFKTAFKTHQGHYQFRVMPFGLTNAPATFQCIMNQILGPYLRKFVMVFLDDILIYSQNLESHLIHLQVLNVLRTHQFYIKLSKCSFPQQELEYLGHIIPQEGVSTDPSKTEAILKWPTPTNPTELWGFLGLNGYYRKFVKDYGIIAKPPINLLKKKQLLWSDVADQAFQELKKATSSTTVLAMPNFNDVFTMETDACASGIGVVLLQKGQPIAFFSKELATMHQHLSIYEKEFLAVIMAVERWRPYLQRQEFITITDHKSLSCLGDQYLQSELQKKAMTRLMGLQFKIVYKKGLDNLVADALSRVGHAMAIPAVSEILPLWIQEVINSYVTDSEAQQLSQQLAITSPDNSGYYLNKGVIRQGTKIWVGHNSALRTKLIAAFHDSALGGHFGVQGTYQRVKRMFVWEGLKQDVDSFVKHCGVCQQAKHERSKPAGLLQPLPIPAGAWQIGQWIS